MLVELVGRVVDVASVERVSDRLDREAMLGIPRARATMQVGNEVRGISLELGQQQIAKQVVVAEPRSVLVERDHEQVRALQLPQDLLAVVAFGDGIAQRSGQPREDGGAHQEMADRTRLREDDLVPQVVDQEALVGRKLLQNALAVRGAPQRQRREVQSRHPTLGPALQSGHLGRCQVEPVNAVEELRSLLIGEAQIPVSQLDQITHRPQTAQAQAIVAVRGDRQVNVIRQALHQVIDLIMDLGSRDELEVVEHQHERLGYVGEAVDQHREELIVDREHGAPQAPRGGIRRRRLYGRDSRHDIAPELQRVVIGRIERHPRESGLAATGGPLGQGARLPPSGRGADQGHLGSQPLLEQLDHVWTWQREGSRIRHQQLRPHNDEARFGLVGPRRHCFMVAPDRPPVKTLRASTTLQPMGLLGRDANSQRAREVATARHISSTTVLGASARCDDCV